MDIISLFPSIPQNECLQILKEEMNSHRDLLLFDPNLILTLLNINVHNNYFEFANCTFQQTTGIAMGAAFSPTIANIFMSKFLKKFLKTEKEQLLFLSRYIDDIFIIWPTRYNLDKFAHNLNNFHPNIKFTITTSVNKIDFLDLTIYKGHNFSVTKLLDTKTFQKPNSLYQYLYFDSFHPKTTFKAIIIGECIRYARSNTEETNYIAQTSLLRDRLLKRNYPLRFINNNINKVNYHNRNLFINRVKKPSLILARPIFKCLPPPNYKHLQQVILTNYNFHNISHRIQQPLFVTLRHKTLTNSLVKSKLEPTKEDIINIHHNCHLTTTVNSQHSAGTQLHKQQLKTTRCNIRNCATCQHINEATYFTSTTTRKSYPIRSKFTCSSSNVIYLITCTNCKKQYVGKTTKTLRERINHHRSTILRNQNRYISIHFNFPDHKITNLKVQIIDSTDKRNNLDSLEKFWIQTLRTVKPNGLNFID